MSIFGWKSRRAPQPTEVKPEARPTGKLRKIDREAAAERARKNSPWRFDDGPSRRPVGEKIDP
jgi:hypothetical protein